MSLSLILVPMAIGILSTTAETISDIIIKKNITTREIKKVRTCFKDSILLQKTLREYGAEVKVQDENYIIAKFSEGKIVYYRENPEDMFEMSIDLDTDVDGLICSIKSLEEDYARNVQSYTYDKVIAGLENNMSIEKEEVLEDDSILITINID